MSNVLGNRPLATTTSDANTVDDIALLGLISQSTSLIRTRGTAGTVDNMELAELLMHSQQSSTSGINWELSPRNCDIIPPSTVKKLANSQSS